MSPLPRQGRLFLIEFLKWYFSKYWQVRTRPVFAQTVTYYTSDTAYFTLIFSYAHAYTQICLELIKECTFNKVYEIGKR